jgi:hypothetical protein
LHIDDELEPVDAWRAVLPVEGTEDDDLSAALDAVKKHVSRRHQGCGADTGGNEEE